MSCHVLRGARKFLWPVLGLLFSVASADVLVMKNGDRITGDITRIWDEEVSIEPAYADEFNVDLSEVEYIDAQRDFEIELSSGRDVVAQLLGADEQGNQLVAVGDQLIAVPLTELKELEEPEDFFDWSSNIDMALGINKGNTDSQEGRFSARGRVKIGEHRHSAELTFNREEQNQETIKEQDIFRYSYNWLFADPWFLGLNLDTERDPIRELDHRIILSAAIGRDVWNDADRLLKFSLGTGYLNEEISGDQRDSATMVWNLEFMQDLLGGDLAAFHNHLIFSNVTGRTNTVIKTSTGLSYEISDLLNTRISVDYDYETNPAALAENEDLALLFGLGLEFD